MLILHPIFEPYKSHYFLTYQVMFYHCYIVSHYPNFIITILEDQKYMESFYNQQHSIKSELKLISHNM